jgi:hypothetical protein
MKNVSRVRAYCILAALILAVPSVVTATADNRGATAIVARMVAAHGGMEKWRDAPSVSFTEEWTTPRSSAPRVSHVIVEQGRRRALKVYPETGEKIGWDGKKAWSLHWTYPAPPRFVVGLTYYFANLPWLVEDPGVVLGEPRTAELQDDPTHYISIRVTYEPGVGDTPDDYYILFIDPKTYELHGCEYVVTYPGLVPEGMAHTPPHVLVYGPLVTVEGLKVPSRFDIYGKNGSAYGSCELSDWSFHEPFDAAMVEMPKGAVVDVSMDWPGAGLDTVRRLETERRSAMIDGDRSVLERLLSPDCTYTHSTGLVQTRAEVIEMLESKKVRYVSFTTPDETLRAFGEGTVVITGTQTIDLEVSGKPRSTTNRFTVVWANVDGAWKCVAYQSTAVPETKERR